VIAWMSIAILAKADELDVVELGENGCGIGFSL
jgi:hypothetical protein